MKNPRIQDLTQTPLISQPMRIRFFTLVLFCAATSPAFASGRADVADAMMHGDQAALRRLVQQKADVNGAQIDGVTALHWAVYRDDVAAARLLLTAGAKVDVQNREGITPIYMAAVYGHRAMIGMFLKAGANAK